MPRVIALVILMLVALAPPRAATAGEPADLSASLRSLRRADLHGAARVLHRRVNQRARKMKLEPAQARAIAATLLRRLPDLPSCRALHDVMPRSLVELIRAVEERGVPPGEAETIAAYLVGLVRVLRFGNLSQLDENHAHVIGRDWHEIDYSGEGTTWRARRAEWSRHGVVSFKRAIFLHRYFTQEEKLPYFRRIYRPRGRMADVPPPGGRPG